MLWQHYYTERKVTLVMPIGSDENQMGELNSWSALERLLRETLFFMMRMEQVGAVTMRFQKVGHVAMSGFSWGINFVTPILESAPSTATLREVYSFDGIERKGRAPKFNQALVQWLRKIPADDEDERWFRIYTQDVTPDQALVKLVAANQPSIFNVKPGTQQPVAQTVTVEKGWDLHSKDAKGAEVTRPAKYPVVTREWQGDGRTLLSAPHVAWQGLVDPEPVGRKGDDGQFINDVDRFYDWVHPFIPKFFTFHAIDKSGFRK